MTADLRSTWNEYREIFTKEFFPHESVWQYQTSRSAGAAKPLVIGDVPVTVGGERLDVRINRGAEQRTLVCQGFIGGPGWGSKSPANGFSMNAASEDMPSVGTIFFAPWARDFEHADEFKGFCMGGSIEFTNQIQLSLLLMFLGFDKSAHESNRETDEDMKAFFQFLLRSQPLIGFLESLRSLWHPSRDDHAVFLALVRTVRNMMRASIAGGGELARFFRGGMIIASTSASADVDKKKATPSGRSLYTPFHAGWVSVE